MSDESDPALEAMLRDAARQVLASGHLVRANVSGFFQVPLLAQNLDSFGERPAQRARAAATAVCIEQGCVGALLVSPIVRRGSIEIEIAPAPHYLAPTYH